MDGSAPLLDPAAAAWAALALAGALALWGAVSDLRAMRIPNALNAALALAFLPVGLAALPLDAVLWRLAAGLGVLVLGYGAFALGQVGGGDVKMLAAAALWVPPERAGPALMLLSLALLVGLAAVLLIRRLGPEGARWRGLDPRTRRYPMGLSIGAALLAHLLISLPGPAA